MIGRVIQKVVPIALAIDMPIHQRRRDHGQEPLLDQRGNQPPDLPDGYAQFMGYGLLLGVYLPIQVTVPFKQDKQFAFRPGDNAVDTVQNVLKGIFKVLSGNNDLHLAAPIHFS
jgi:hypothetical protein